MFLSFVRRLKILLPVGIFILVTTIPGALQARNSRSQVPPGFRDGYVRVNGVRLHYVRGGVGEPLVLLHGFPQHWYEWRKVMPALAETHDVIAVDMRGAGQSDAPATGYDKATLAEDLRGLVQQLNLDPINLVGHDIGLMVAYAYAAKYPGDVQRLVLMEAPIPDESVYTYPALTPNGPGPWWFGFFSTPHLPEILIQGREQRFVNEFFRSSVPPKVAGSITPTDVAAYAHNLRSRERLNAYASYFGTFPQDIRQVQQWRQAPLPMPVLAVGGEFSGGAGVAEQAKRYATNVTGEIIAGSGHWIPEEKPKELVNLLGMFLSQSASTNTRMPTLVGFGEDEAKEVLSELGITNVLVDYQGPDRIGDVWNQFPPYTVVSHIPEAGTIVTPETSVVLGIRAP